MIIWVTGSPVFLIVCSPKDSTEKRIANWQSIVNTLEKSGFVSINVELGWLGLLMKTLLRSKFFHSLCVLDVFHQFASGRRIAKLANPWGDSFSTWILSVILNGLFGSPSKYFQENGTFFVDFLEIYSYIHTICLCLHDYLPVQWRSTSRFSLYFKDSFSAYDIVNAGPEFIVEIFSNQGELRQLSFIHIDGGMNISNPEIVLYSDFDSCLCRTINSHQNASTIIPLSFFPDYSNPLFNIAVHAKYETIQISEHYVSSDKVNLLLCQICANKGVEIFKDLRTTIYDYIMSDCRLHLVCAETEEQDVYCRICVKRVGVPLYFMHGSPPTFKTVDFISKHSSAVLNVLFTPDAHTIDFDYWKPYVVIAAINCNNQENFDVCKNQQIIGYPTFMIYTDPTDPIKGIELLFNRMNLGEFKSLVMQRITVNHNKLDWYSILEYRPIDYVESQLAKYDAIIVIVETEDSFQGRVVSTIMILVR
ncbi:hypothetical protein GJ496_006068 [Pomphorhynchus laevis]|nr:hypothetical protein GJ496_006068 [Pomphorhynchus laevis]